MDHEFELAFNLLDEAAGRIGHQQDGTTRSCSTTTAKSCSPRARLHPRHRTPPRPARQGRPRTMAAIEATAPDLDTAPRTRILKVRADDLTFHAVPGTWTYRASDAFLIAKANQAATICDQVSLHSADPGRDGSSELAATGERRRIGTRPRCGPTGSC